MKATISYLFNTDRKIISFDNSEFYRPTSISDLKKCDNVLVDKKDKVAGAYPVIIDDSFYYVTEEKIRHTGGTMLVLEIY